MFLLNHAPREYNVLLDSLEDHKQHNFSLFSSGLPDRVFVKSQVVSKHTGRTVFMDFKEWGLLPAHACFTNIQLPDRHRLSLKYFLHFLTSRHTLLKVFSEVFGTSKFKELHFQHWICSRQKFTEFINIEKVYLEEIKNKSDVYTLELTNMCKS